MAIYTATGQRTASATAAVAALENPASGPVRGFIFRLVFGSEATPADNPYLWQLQRSTVLSTGGATTPGPLANDGADAAATLTFRNGALTDGTLTSNAMALSVPLNQRATFQIFLGLGEEIVIPATANNGVHIRTPTATALAVTTTCFFRQ